MPNDFQTFAVGVKVRFTGTVLKVVRRSEALRLVLDLSVGPGGFEKVFANFSADVFKANKVRKGKVITIAGQLLCYGSSAVCLSGCKIIAEGVKNRGLKRGKMC